MAYDADLAERIRELLAPERDVTEKKMFGGLAFLVGGRMAVAATGDGLMVRVPPEDTEQLLAGDHVGEMVMSGRDIRGWVLVAAAGLTTDDALREWVSRGADSARNLPPR